MVFLDAHFGGSNLIIYVILLIMEIFKQIKIPDDLERPSTKEEIDEEYVRAKTQQSSNITAESFEDGNIRVAIEGLSHPLFDIKLGLNSVSLGNNGQNMEISFLCSKFDPFVLSPNQTMAWFNLEESLRREGIKDRSYFISSMKIVINGEELDLSLGDKDGIIVSPLINGGITTKDLFKRALLSKTNPDSGIIYSGLPLNNILAFFNLFHEIGHHRFSHSIGKEREKEYRVSTRKDEKDRTIEDQANVLEEERNASAFALENARKMIKFFGIDQRYLSKIVHFYLTSYIKTE
jgi:hypothetical protein